MIDTQMVNQALAALALMAGVVTTLAVLIVAAAAVHEQHKKNRAGQGMAAVNKAAVNEAADKARELVLR